MRGSSGRFGAQLGVLATVAALALAACSSGTGTGGATPTTAGPVPGSAGAAGDAGGPTSSASGPATSGDGAAGAGGAIGAAAGATTTTSAPTGLDRFDFLNFTYDFGPDLGKLTLVNGEYQKGNFGDLDFIRAELVRVATGDLTADGQSDAAVTLYFTTGGTGQFTDVFVYRWTSEGPALVARDGVGDRADDGVRRAEIANGQLVIDRYRGQGACCPDQVVRRLVAVQGNKLVDKAKEATFALITLDIDGVDAAKAQKVKFLPGTSTGFLESAVPTPPAVFDARQGQQLTLQVQETGRQLHVAPLDLVQNGTVVGTARVGAPLITALPTTGSYEIRPVVDAKAPSDLIVSAELSITG